VRQTAEGTCLQQTIRNSWLTFDIEAKAPTASFGYGTKRRKRRANPAEVLVACRDPRDAEALTLWGLALCFRGQSAGDRGNEEGSGDLRAAADELFQAGVQKFEAAIRVDPDLWTGECGEGRF
jgi:hypothetical protein